MHFSFTEEVGPLHAAAPEILSRLMSAEGDTAELFSEHTYHERIRMRYDRWKAYRDPWEDYATDVVEGTGLRLLTNGFSRHGAAEGFDPALIRIKADELRDGPPIDVSLDRESARGSLALPGDTINLVSLDEKRALLESAVDAALSLEPRLRDLEVDFQGSTRQAYVVSTEDRPTFSAKSIIGFRVQAKFERANRHIDVYAIGGGTGGLGQFLLCTPEEISQRCIERLQAALKARPLDRDIGDVPVVIEGGWGGVWLHEAVGHLLEADTPGAYTPERIGDQVAGDGVTIVDDGTLEHGRGTALFDDEGFPMERTVLVDRGVLRAVMTDRIQARRHGLPRTGNGRRQDFRRPPMVRMTNLLLEGGTEQRETLISEAEDGFYVRTIGGGQVYPSEDRFAFNVIEGYKIEGGRLTEPLTNVQITGRPSQMLEDIIGIADDYRIDPSRGICKKDDQTVPVSVGMPTVLVRDLTVRRVL
ncbi:MAG: TldD/PmbA family protein [Rhodothermales bacterium]